MPLQQWIIFKGYLVRLVSYFFPDSSTICVPWNGRSWSLDRQARFNLKETKGDCEDCLLLLWIRYS